MTPSIYKMDHPKFIILNQKEESISTHLHFLSKPLMNLYIFATVHSLMNYTLIDSCQAQLPMQCASNIEWPEVTLVLLLTASLTESYMQNKPLVFSIGCPCSSCICSWLFYFSALHSNKTVNTIIF